jgi:hypothetical protein
LLNYSNPKFHQRVHKSPSGEVAKSNSEQCGIIKPSGTLTLKPHFSSKKVYWLMPLKEVIAVHAGNTGNARSNLVGK